MPTWTLPRGLSPSWSQSMSSKFMAATPEQYEEIASHVPKEYKVFVDHIFTVRLCTVKSLLEAFPATADSDLAMLSVIGSINGAIYSKCHAAVYPAEVSPSIEESAYSLGVLTTGKK